MRNLRILFSLLLTTACFGQLGNVNLKPIDGMPFVNRTHRLARGIVGMWLFNDRPLALGTTRDLSGYGNHGTLVGDTHSVPGKFGPALDFDGSGDYVGVGDFRSSFTDQVSVSVQVTSTNNSNFPMIFSAARGSGEGKEGFELRTYASSGIPSFSVDESTGRIQTTVGTSIVGEGYKHIVGTYNGSLVSIYVNGVLIESVAGSGNIEFGLSGSDWRIGNRGTAGGFDWTGELDYILIHNRALNASEIKELYRNPFQMFKQERIPIAVAAAPPTGGRSFGVIIASIPFGIFGICGIAVAFGYSERKAA